MHLGRILNEEELKPNPSFGFTFEKIHLLTLETHNEVLAPGTGIVQSWLSQVTQAGMEVTRRGLKHQLFPASSLAPVNLSASCFCAGAKSSGCEVFTVTLADSKVIKIKVTLLAHPLSSCTWRHAIFEISKKQQKKPKKAKIKFHPHTLSQLFSHDWTPHYSLHSQTIQNEECKRQSLVEHNSFLSICTMLLGCVPSFCT